mmetsp:Transcript_7235/g.18529  ORF Transcript_7235/g.18529 Transcript_7235/m.18529 type:complete len:255 (+) Transcript_7235:81-845(+)
MAGPVASRVTMGRCGTTRKGIRRHANAVAALGRTGHRSRRARVSPELGVGLCRIAAPGNTASSRADHLIAKVSVSVNDFKTGLTVQIDNAPWRVVEHMHVKPGKGAAFVRSKLKNVISGNVLDKTFRAGEKVEVAQVEKSVKQFTYMDGDQFVFMDMESYDEIRLSKDSWSKYLKEGMEVDLLEWNGQVIGVELPRTVSLLITETDPGVRGNTVSGGSKPATLETGAVVTIPLFVQQGEVITVDTVTGEYKGRG